MLKQQIALYMRLSQEDKNSGESNSIKNQRELLTEFINRHEELSHLSTVEFCDDGYSGTNFNRPSIKDLLEAIRNRAISCIVVKDLSRFGRNYIEVSDYLEQVFPFLGVRFISINDGYDSDTAQGSTGDMEVSLRTLLYDLYSKDLSIKVKSGLNAKKNKGYFVASATVYGYKKSSENKNKLEIDEQSATVVRLIFDMIIEGKSSGEVAKYLNTKEILTRSEYKYSIGKGKACWGKTRTISFWKPSDVREIIKNEAYTGAAISNKFIKTVVGKPATKLPKEDWTVVKGVNPAIVNEEVFKKANEILKIKYKRNLKNNKQKPIFYGKIRCGCCNLCLRRYETKNPSYICNTPLTTYSPNCVSELVLESTIKEVTLNAIKKIMGSIPNPNNDKAVTTQNYSKTIKELENSLNKLNAEKQSYYEGFKDEKITKEDYLTFKNTCDKQINLLNAQISSLKLNATATISNKAKALDMSELTCDLVEQFVENIIISNEGKIDVKIKSTKK